MTVSPPRTRCPLVTVIVHSGGTKTSIREPNFIRPIRSPVASRWPGAGAGDDPPGQDADDLPEDDGAVAVAQPQLAALVPVRGLLAVGGQEAALAVGALDDLAAVRRAVDVHVDDGEEDADLLPVALGGDAGLRLAGDHHHAVGGGEDLVGGRRRRCRSAGRGRGRTAPCRPTGRGTASASQPGPAPAGRPATARTAAGARGPVMKGHPARSMRIVAKRYRPASGSARHVPVSAAAEARSGSAPCSVFRPRGGPPYQSRQTIVASSREVAAGGVQDRGAELVDHLARVQVGAVGERRGDVEVGGVALLHAVGEQDDPVARLEREVLDARRPCPGSDAERCLDRAASISSTRPSRSRSGSGCPALTIARRAGRAGRPASAGR